MLLPHKYILPSSVNIIVFLPPEHIDVIICEFNDLIGEGRKTFSFEPTPISPYVLRPHPYM